MKGANSSYWGGIKEGVKSMTKGLTLSLSHFKKAVTKKKRPPVGVFEDNYLDHQEGIFTLEYPKESLPVPDNGRYRLHNEIDDCIVCDKCAKVCPVNCIDIEAIKSPSEIKKASDGSSIRLYPAKFDIDMAKCCFCGLCTTVCPTECLTMTKTYDFSEYDLNNLNYEFTYLSPEEADQKKQEYEAFQEAKKAKSMSAKASGENPAASKPVAGQPKIKIPGKSSSESAAKPKVVIPGKKPGAPKPKVIIPGAKKSEEGDKKTSSTLKPKIPGSVGAAKTGEAKKTPSLRPKIPGAVKKEGEEPKKSSPLKPKIPTKKTAEDEKGSTALKPKIPGAKSAGEAKKTSPLKPKIPLANKSDKDEKGTKKASPLKPVIKPKRKEGDDGDS